MVAGEWVREERRRGDERIVARSWMLYGVSTRYVCEMRRAQRGEKRLRSVNTECEAQDERSEDTRDAWYSTDTSSVARIIKKKSERSEE